MTSTTSGNKRSSQGDVKPTDDALRSFGRRNDGSNGSLPHLSAAQLDIFMTIHAQLEDPDALQGIQAVRQIQGYPCTPWNRILELEQTEDWLGAMVEFGLLHNSLVMPESGSLNLSQALAYSGLDSAQKMASLTPLSHSSRESSNSGSASANSQAKKMKRAPVVITRSLRKDSVHGHRKESPTGESVHCGTASQGSDEGDGSGPHDIVTSTPAGSEMQYEEADAVDWHKLAEVERGRLRCLVELGHLDSAVDQVIALALVALLALYQSFTDFVVLFYFGYSFAIIVMCYHFCQDSGNRAANPAARIDTSAPGNRSVVATDVSSA